MPANGGILSMTSANLSIRYIYIYIVGLHEIDLQLSVGHQGAGRGRTRVHALWWTRWKLATRIRRHLTRGHLVLAGYSVSSFCLLRDVGRTSKVIIMTSSPSSDVGHLPTSDIIRAEGCLLIEYTHCIPHLSMTKVFYHYMSHTGLN